MKLTMKSPVLLITQVLNKTKAKMFCNLKAGDTIQLSIPVESVGTDRGGYAAYIHVINLKTKETVKKSFNQIGYILDNFDIEEYKKITDVQYNISKLENGCKVAFIRTDENSMSDCKKCCFRNKNNYRDCKKKEIDKGSNAIPFNCSYPYGYFVVV